MSNSKHPRVLPFLARLLLPSALVLAVGCGDSSDDASSPSAQSQDTSIVQGPVARADFCGLFDKIECETAVNCCSSPEGGFTSVDACLAASPCKNGLGQLLDSPRVASNEVRYDDAAAGDFLRARESNKKDCGVAAPPGESLPFLVGTIEEGGDCTPDGKDLAVAIACKPGLGCRVESDAATNKIRGTCVQQEQLSIQGNLGDACADDEGCGHGSCVDGKCAPPTEGFCAAPPEKTPPSNAVPGKMYIKAHKNSNSGTTGDIKVGFATGGKYYECTITATISDGGTQECTVSYTSTSYTSYAAEFFVVENPSGDGLQLDTVCAKDSSGNVIECAGTFLDLGAKASCNGCTVGYCGRCWVDADGNGNCKKMVIQSSFDNFISCE